MNNVNLRRMFSYNNINFPLILTLICLYIMQLIKTPSFSIIVIITMVINDSHIKPNNQPLIRSNKTIHGEQENHTTYNARIRTSYSCMHLRPRKCSKPIQPLGLHEPTSTNPFKVFALYLVELVGRAAPVFIDHTKQNDEYWDNNEECIHNAINFYQEVRTDTISINFFTRVTPERTMYQDICEIVMLNKVDFIILPFHKKMY